MVPNLPELLRDARRFEKLLCPYRDRVCHRARLKPRRFTESALCVLCITDLANAQDPPAQRGDCLFEARIHAGRLLASIIDAQTPELGIMRDRIRAGGSSPRASSLSIASSSTF